MNPFQVQALIDRMRRSSLFEREIEDSDERAIEVIGDPTIQAQDPQIIAQFLLQGTFLPGYSDHTDVLRFFEGKKLPVKIRVKADSLCKIQTYKPLMPALIENYESECYQMLKKYCQNSVSQTESSTALCQAMLIGGLKYPLLPDSLLKVQFRIEAEVANLLSPFGLSPETSCEMTPSFLKSLPQLIQWIGFIDSEDTRNLTAQVIEDSRKEKPDVEESSGRKDNRVLVEAMKQFLPNEIIDVVLNNFAQERVVHLLANKLVKRYGFSSEFSKCYANDVVNHKSNYVAFLDRLFDDNNWLILSDSPAESSSRVLP